MFSQSRALENLMLCNNILEAIGRTPLVRLNRIQGDARGTLLAKI